jgi:hypothetical protein
LVEFHLPMQELAALLANFDGFHRRASVKEVDPLAKEPFPFVTVLGGLSRRNLDRRQRAGIRTKKVRNIYFPELA